ncbi:microsomal triglyceride transfer protein large subunit-like [Ostrea edulis]|uniref:microsomal triglyceride transfer protein large subunit-like n=1 Tax=Ostrea edulis TaxID=37623 RepID=UPI0024AF3A3A|nr:microsomal triglyceride transfer protein large subunit-like [Ostrea edulis]
MAGSTGVNFKTLICFFALFHECFSLTFGAGKTYKYSYETVVNFNEAVSNGKSVGFKLTTEFDIGVIFKAGELQLLKVQVTAASISSFARHEVKGELVKLLKYPIYFEYTNGVIGKIYASEIESVFCANVKKGLLSLFQIQETEGQRDEVDVSGECSAYYAVYGGRITKTKQNCQNVEIAGEFDNVNKVLGVSVDNTFVTHYDIAEGVIKSASGSSRHSVITNARPQLGAAVVAIQRLSYIREEDGTAYVEATSAQEAISLLYKDEPKKYQEMLLPSGPEVQECIEDCEKPVSVLQSVKEDLTSDKLSKIVSGKAFLKLLSAFRNSGKSTIEEVMTHKDSYHIVKQLIDVGVATQTLAAHEALMQLISFTDKDAIDYPERFILASAYATHPGEYLLKDMLELMKKKVPNESLRESIALGLGAVVNSFCKPYGNCLDYHIIAEYVNYVESELKACVEEGCILLYIRSVGNSGLPKFLPLLLDQAQNSQSSAVSLTAIQSLRRMQINDFRQEVFPVLKSIFHQNKRKYDSSVRIAALEILLQNGVSTGELCNIVLSAIYDQTEFEVSTYLIKRLRDLSESDPNFRTSLSIVLSDSRVNNYNLFAQRGKSSAFTGYLAETAGSNCTYGLYQENTKTGVMKKSAMVVNVLNKQATQPLLTFGIYADGIEALVGDAAEGEEAVDATAGLSLTMLDVLLRPVEFFRGMSGLMSAVWSAPSEPVSALQGNLLLQDYSHKIHMSNGLVVDASILGVASIDLSGSVSISLWYKNSHSVITNSGALVTKGSLQIDSKELRSGIKFSTESEAFIDFQTDVDFAEMPVKMCLQMKRPPVTSSHFVEKFEKSRHLKKRLAIRKKRSSATPPVSYFINEKNSAMCTTMDPDN